MGEVSRQRITADKKFRYASPKLPSATSFIRKTLSEIARFRKRMSMKTDKETAPNIIIAIELKRQEGRVCASGRCKTKEHMVRKMFHQICNNRG